MNVDMGEIAEKETLRPKITDSKGILQQNREFLDFFWDIAKPEQDTRLRAIENLVQYLKTSEKPDELEYTIKRLIEGLAHTREVARPGFSLALGQLLSSLVEISLQSVLDRVKEKHSLQSTKKKLLRNALFGNFFGVLALSQSTRLTKEPQVVLGCVQLLQSLSQHRDHLKDLPTKTMMDILSDTPEEVFEAVLIQALKTDLSSPFRTPEQLQLLLVAMQRFPKSFKPKKLNKLLGSSTVVTADNTQKLTELLRTAAVSVKKDCALPGVAVDLLKLSLREDSFHLFWTEVIVKGMLTGQPGPTHYLCYRLLGSALPHLSLEQLRKVLSGEVMRHYGEHVTSAQKPGRFQLAPEMEAFVTDFLQGCEDPDKQLAVVVGFSKLTNQGSPVVPSNWGVVRHLGAVALQRYVDWLKATFLHPQLEACLDFSTRKQKSAAEDKTQKDGGISRLRKWLVTRLVSIVENHSVKREEDLVMDVARFVFFHAFFAAKKATPDIPETEAKLSVALDQSTRAALVNGFFGLLQCMHHLPLLGEPAETAASTQRRPLGVTADGTMWLYCLVQYAQVLLTQPKYIQSSQPFSPEQRQAWDSMHVSVAALMKKTKTDNSPENNAFQQLFMLVGINLFKCPEDLLDIMQDIQSCITKAQEKKKKKKRAKEDEEPHWAEVVVDILLSLLSQPSRHIRHVCKTVFSSICPHVTAAALTSILDVLDPDKDETDSALVVTNQDSTMPEEEDEDDEMEDVDKDSSDEEEDEEEEEDDDDEDDDDDDEDEAVAKDDVDPNFRLELMKVLQQQNALGNEEDGSDEEEMDDEAMMKLDASMAALFSEQKKKMEAKREEKAKVHKEKTLILDFRMKVLDLLEVFVAKQAGSPLVLGLVEPLLKVIERSMSSDHQQEQDFIRRVADIFRNQLCRSKVYCRTAGDRQGELHDLLEKLVNKAQKHTDSSVSLYFFSASLYLVKVLRGGLPSAETKEDKTPDAPSIQDLRFMGSVDVERVSTLFREALSSFMSKRNSPLTGQMFCDLFNRFPVLGVNLMDMAVNNITNGVREHQQGQACMLVLRALQSRELQQLLAGDPWVELCGKVVEQLAATLKQVGQCQSKVIHEKAIKALELSLYLVKNIQTKKLSVDLGALQEVLRSMTESVAFKKTGQLEDTYWAVMKYFGVTKPKAEKMKTSEEKPGQQTLLPKKKGFLPEQKKRRNRKKRGPAEGAGDGPDPAATESGGDQEQAKKKKRKRKRKERVNPEGASPAKKAKPQPGNKPAKNKKKAKKQGDGSQ